MSDYFLGIDGGGSKTRAVVVNADYEILGRGEAGAANHFAVGVATAARNCALAAQNALANARDHDSSFNAENVRSWGFGLAGVRRESDAARMRDALGVVCIVPFALETDVVAAHAGAFAGATGIVVSGGTGAITFGADEFGARVYADGWGPVLGDEGGGYWLGVEALRATCRALDGRAHPTPLAHAVMEFLEIREGEELVQMIYSPNITRDAIASIARVVSRCAEEGVPEAVDIRARGAQALSRGVRCVGKALLQSRQERNAAPVEMLIALRGGLFEDDFLRATVGFNATEAMVELKRDFLPISGWRVVKPQHDASVGAAILGQLSL
ncbi:N-acetylmuramic acid/N-acetylglucosamine kinase [Abditibacteriota bacterium]|nr:N-acetylmuramic acid/N-acetylglucosamine kinase [Abditibacteriota bacterium]